MVRRPFVSFARLASVLASIVSHAAAADGRDGAQLAALCASCHSLDNRGGRTAPIVGLDAEKLVGMMLAFRSDVGSNHIMHAVSLSLTDAEIAVLADHLGMQGKEAK